MIKQITLLIHLIFLTIYSWFSSRDIQVTIQGENRMLQGQYATLSITVNKGDLAGIAKLQISFPEGFIVESVENAGANFVFEDNKAKFIWIALPSSPSFTVKLKYLCNIPGEYQIGGKFYYVADNQSANIDLPVTKLIIDSNESPQTKVPEIPSFFQCTRQIATTDNQNFIVNLRITKSNIKGFVKIEEVIPDGFQVQVLQSADAAFGFKNGIAKFSWAEMPEENDLVVTYKLTPKINTKEGEYVITGAYVINKNQTSEKTPLEESRFYFKKSQPVSSIEEPVVETKPMPEKKEPQRGNLSPTIDFKVQIAAGHKPVSDAYFKAKFHINEKIYRENHEGWIKYLVGNFKEYKDARDKRNIIWNRHNIKDAFVVAYNNGNRISVQEALMITNQQWIK